jgi:FAD synthetase
MKIIQDSSAKSLANEKITLVGGCFDIIHPGHLEFLKRANKLGNKLAVMLESDENIRKIKGSNRPLNNQNTRANNLSKILYVDYIILLNNPESSQYYYNLVKSISPAIIAVTSDDPLIEVKKEQANSVQGIVVEVMKRDLNHSTTKMLQNKSI